jgi:ribosome-associated heat shock protein Hsp15
MKPTPDDSTGKVRLDKWLWAARFYKTRGLSSEAIDKGHVRLNGLPVKPSRDVKPGDTLELHIGPDTRTVVVRGLSGVRGPAPVAALLYEETAASLLQRSQAAELRRLAPEPAHSLAMGRPTKRDRRQIEDLREAPPRGEWNERWSASLDEEDD